MILLKVFSPHHFIIKYKQNLLKLRISIKSNNNTVSKKSLHQINEKKQPIISNTNPNFKVLNLFIYF